MALGRGRKSLPGPHSFNLDVATNGKYFYALTVTCTTTAVRPCSHFALDRSSVTSTSWMKLKVPAIFSSLKNNNVSIAAAGSRVWMTTQNQISKPWPTYLATSTNDGTTFSVTVQPDLASVAECELISASSRVLWADCDGGNMDFAIAYSPDGGDRWQMPRGPSLLTQQGVEAFDPISNHTAYFVNGSRPGTLFRVSNETSVPRRVASIPKGRLWSSIVFTNANDGVMLTLQNEPSVNLYGTDNGGVSWRRITLSR